MRFPDILEVITQGLDSGARPKDNLLHCSKHIWWPLRFSQLEMSGEHMEPPEFLDQINMLTGTLHHSWIQEHLKRSKDRWWELVATEIDLTPYLPEGWTGTADWVFYDKEADHCILGDYKTIKPEAVQYLTGVKSDHLLQLSCYNLGLTMAGYNMAPELFVFYLPKNKVWTHSVAPQQLSAKPIEYIRERMTTIRDEVLAYTTGQVALSRMPLPELKTSWNTKTGVFDVREVPNWMEAYTCPFNESLCPRTKSRKLGHFDLNRKWTSRLNHKPIGFPTEAMYRKRAGYGPLRPVLQSVSG